MKGKQHYYKQIEPQPDKVRSFEDLIVALPPVKVIVPRTPESIKRDEGLKNE
jgi:hypothetical protein